MIRQLFQVEPQLVKRTNSLVQALMSQAIPHLVFTLDRPGTLTPLQRAFVSGPGVEVERQYGPSEILYESVRDRTYV